MSLKHFHLFFIVASIVIVLWYGYWEISMIGKDASGRHIMMAILSLAIATGMVVYLAKVYRIFKRINA